MFAVHGGNDCDIAEGNIAIHFVTNDVLREVKRHKAKAVKFKKEIRRMPWGAYQATFIDPDGNEMD